MYKVIALVGKAGSGKDTMANKLVESDPNKYKAIVSYTTRPPREGEIDGVNYYFITPNEFIEKVNKGIMLEYTQFNNWFYGAGIDQLDKEKINVGVFELRGLSALQENPDVEVYSFYLHVKDKIRLMRQLKREFNPDVDEIVRRYLADQNDFAMADIYEFTEKFVNDDWNQADLILDKIRQTI